MTHPTNDYEGVLAGVLANTASAFRAPQRYQPIGNVFQRTPEDSFQASTKAFNDARSQINAAPSQWEEPSRVHTVNVADVDFLGNPRLDLQGNPIFRNIFQANPDFDAEKTAYDNAISQVNNVTGHFANVDAAAKTQDDNLLRTGPNAQKLRQRSQLQQAIQQLLAERKPQREVPPELRLADPLNLDQILQAAGNG